MNCIGAISKNQDDIFVKIHVIAGSTQSLFPAGYNKWRKCIEIKVKAEAKENKANIEILQLISSFLGIEAKKISITSGEKSREKLICIKHQNTQNICNKIEESLHGL